MKILIPQINLAALIARGGETAAKKSPIPVLNCFRLTAADGLLALASTDQDRFAEAKGAATIEAPGSICVDAVAFTTLIGKHPKNGVIGLELQPQESGKGERLLVTCGRSKVKLPTFPADTFPAWADAPALATFSLPGADFKRAFSRVRFAASTDDSRHYLQGVHLDADEGNLHFVATDGHRLAISGMPTPSGAEDCPPVIVPSEGVDAALKVFDGAGTVTMAVGERAIAFEADSLRLSSRLIDGTFVPYEKAIPARGQPGVSFKRADFVDCLNRANVLTGEGALAAIIARPDGNALRLEARNHHGGEAIEELPALADEGLQPFGFNARYAAEFLSTLSVGSLTLEHEGGQKGILIHSDDAPDFIGVLWPMAVAL